MKFFSLLSVALAKECYESVFSKGAAAERGELRHVFISLL